MARVTQNGRAGGIVPQGWRVGTIGGVEIRLDISLVFIAFFISLSLATRLFPFDSPGESPLLYWTVAFFASLIFIMSVLWHEMAHSLLAIRYGIPVVKIVLHLFGGVAQIAREPERPIQEFWIAVAGPASSFLLAGIFWLLCGLGGLIGTACLWLAVINMILALFNLLPGFPLDGGRILRALLWRQTGSYRRATQLASRTGQAIAALFALLGLVMFAEALLLNGLYFMLVAAFLYAAATESYRLSSGAPLSLQAPVRRVMRYNIPIVGPELPLVFLAWRYLDRARDQAFPVMVDGALVGMISSTEVDKIPRLEWSKVRVGQMMLPRERLVVVAPSDDLQTALAAFEATGLEHAPVFDAGQLVGMLNRRDIVYRT